MTTLLISDLHLDASLPAITDQFLSFIDQRARGARTLYILGDLFEAWIGDDDPDPDKRRVVAALRSLTAAGVPCYGVSGMLGDGATSNAHGLNERIRVQTLIEGREFLYRLAKMYADGK